MSVVTRYWLKEDGGLFACNPEWTPADDEMVMWPDFKRVQDERDALQQRLNAADQRIDELERGEKAPLDPPQPISEQFIEDHLGKKHDQLSEAAKMIGIERMPPMEYDEP